MYTAPKLPPPSLLRSRWLPSTRKSQRPGFVYKADGGEESPRLLFYSAAFECLYCFLLVATLSELDGSSQPVAFTVVTSQGLTFATIEYMLREVVIVFFTVLWSGDIAPSPMLGIVMQ